MRVIRNSPYHLDVRVGDKIIYTRRSLAGIGVWVGPGNFDYYPANLIGRYKTSRQARAAIMALAQALEAS